MKRLAIGAVFQYSPVAVIQTYIAGAVKLQSKEAHWLRILVGAGSK
jgi:hypothetical protein